MVVAADQTTKNRGRHGSGQELDMQVVSEIDLF